MMLDYGWDQSQGLSPGWGIGVGSSSQGGIPGRGVTQAFKMGEDQGQQGEGESTILGFP